ncbi:MAG: helix-turn-helix domain-containing protein [Lachnospiraceae bacterium]|nr:helix-turn-helix domain-containing protein [Lachnospiraceae bacterium]
MYYRQNGALIFVDDDADALIHYGKGHLDGGHSGRYPWGSGKEPYQHASDFIEAYREKKRRGLTNAQMAEEFGLTVTEMKTQVSLAGNRVRKDKIQRARDLFAEYQNYTKVGEIMGISDNSVRSLLNDERAERTSKVEKTKELLMAEVDKYKTDKVNGMIDVGKGTAQELGVSETVLSNAVYACYLEGYELWDGGIATGPNMQTHQRVLCSPGTKHGEIYDFENVHPVTEHHSFDGGETFKKLQPPESISSKRIMIRYAEDGGTDKDGVIELRPGVPDISLGKSHYAQVRIAVDGTHYLKGMAVYSDDMPKGVDIIFNTNKHEGTPMIGPKDNSVLKPMKRDKDGNIDKDNPFGANIKSFTAGGQHYYIDKDGKEKLSVINKVKEEGDWDSYSDSLAAQFLVKQPKFLIEKQLNQTLKEKKEEFDEIASYTNPTVKKDLLLTFADECDSAAVHLKAAALPRQKWQVILPSTALKDNEIYAPGYDNGEKVALVRYPHAGIFEIPVLTVNNNNTKAAETYGQLKDAVAINSHVAEQLSGADFDGDTVIVIPTNSKTPISASKPLRQLEGFDPKAQYKIPYEDREEGKKHGYKYMTKEYTQNQMGQVSNLITDMTIKGAPDDEIAMAVKHSMVVIDAEKHGLDYQRSYKDNHIRELKQRWQTRVKDDGSISTGASTLISRSKTPVAVPERKGSPKIDRIWDDEKKTWVDAPEKTGTLYFKTSNREYPEVKIVDPVTGKKTKTSAYSKDGKIYYKNADGNYVEADDSVDLKIKQATTKVKSMMYYDDARSLSSGTLKENLYADYANQMKQLAKDARLMYTNTDDIEYSKVARAAYSKEYDSLKEKLIKAQSKAPRERQAQRYANQIAQAKKKAAIEMSDGEFKKIKQRALEEARVEFGVIGPDYKINITDREWEAIQSGAISKSMLSRILNFTDDTLIKQLALPHESKAVPDTVQDKIVSYYKKGYTPAQIAEQVGLSKSTVYKYLP